MMDTQLALHRTHRISLTKSQLHTSLGAELLSVCESATADGKLTPEEVDDLREWLQKSECTDLPAASYLREVVARVLAHQRVTTDNCREVYRAVEDVLPPEVRRHVTALRHEVEHAERQKAKEARAANKELQRERRQRNSPVASANFMVLGVRYEGRPAIIERHAHAGDPVHLVRDLGNRYSRFAIAVQLMNGEQIGFVPEEDAQRVARYSTRVRGARRG